MLLRVLKVEFLLRAIGMGGRKGERSLPGPAVPVNVNLTLFRFMSKALLRLKIPTMFYSIFLLTVSRGRIFFLGGGGEL
jgi:hypothetical protein